LVISETVFSASSSSSLIFCLSMYLKNSNFSGFMGAITHLSVAENASKVFFGGSLIPDVFPFVK